MLTAPEQPDLEMLRVPVIKVFDGDGFLTRIYHPGRGTAVEVAIRLGFVDAPEMDQPGGPEAQAFLQSIIGGKSVDLAILTKMDTGGIVDRHGRIVAVPYLPVAHQDPPATRRPWDLRLPRNVELEMVLNGWAWVLERYGPDERYFEALEDAQRCRRGIWALDSKSTRGSTRSGVTECPRLGARAQTISRACLQAWNPAAIARQAAAESFWTGADGSVNSSDVPIFRPADIPATASEAHTPC